MRIIKRLRVTVEDESRLEKIISFSISRGKAIAALAAIIIFLVACSTLIIILTPLKTLLPGYMKQSERSAYAETLIRLDSLQHAYDCNQMFIDNISSILAPGKEPDDSLSQRSAISALSSDSILGSSPKARSFVEKMQQRERYNISVIAPLSADGIMFVPPAPNAVFTQESRYSQEGIVVSDMNSPASAIADGSVLATYHSPSGGGYVVIIQHERGFISMLSHLGTPAVETGDYVIAGQFVAAPNQLAGREKNTIRIRIWHNGVPLIPFDYVGSQNPSMTTI